MKPGDQVYCKKNYKWNGTVYFYKGKTYSVHNIRKGTHYDGNIMWSIDINSNLGSQTLNFYEGKYPWQNGLKFSDCFIPLKELRKKKLKKLNSILLP